MRILEDLVARIVATVQEHAGEWCDAVLADEHEARQRVAQSREELARVEQDAARTPKLRHWIERTARIRPGYHVHWGALANPPSTDLLKIANQGRSRANSIPSAELAKQEVQETNEVPDYEDETLDYSSVSYLNQMDEALRQHAESAIGESATGGNVPRR